MTRSRIALLVGVLLAAAAAPRGAAQTPPIPPVPGALAPALPTIDLQEIKAGQRGYGLSVFAGKEPERFAVEVVGVWRNPSPDFSYILARLTGKGLEKSGVIAGMSGSPVFLDGRLAGAVAFSWPFAQEAIAGITPIGLMHRLGDGKDLLQAPPLPPVKLSDLLSGRVPEDLLARQLAALKPPSMLGVGGTASVQWSTAGFGEQSIGMLRAALGSVAPGGMAAPSGGGGGAGNLSGTAGTAGATGAVSRAREEITPGGSVAAVLVDGDMGLAATGTVTDRVGDQVFAFGHPFLGMGPTRVPMATAEVVTVLASQYSSFKITNLGEVVGAFEQDRKAGISGTLGASAPMVPMVLRVQARDRREFRMRLASMPQLMPLLVGSTALAGLESASYTAGPQGIDLKLKIHLAHHGDLELQQTFDSENAGAEAVSHLLAVTAYLTQNPFEKVAIESIDVDLEQVREPRAATLLAAYPDRTVVRPGESLGLNLELRPYRGKAVRQAITIDLPADLPEGKLSLVLGDGASTDAARLAIEPAEPVSFDQALALLNSFHSHREVRILGVQGGAGLSVAGEAMPNLPASVRSLWLAGAPGTTPMRLAIARTWREPMPMPIEGLVRIELEVRQPRAGTAERLADAAIAANIAANTAANRAEVVP